MTTTDVPAARRVPPLPVRARDVVTSEWTKLRSVRANYWTMIAVSAVSAGSAAVVGYSLAAAPRTPPGGPFTPVIASFLGYAEYAVIPVAVLGVLAFTSEYSTGQIRTTFTAEPRRWAVLAAKAAVTGAAALIVGELLAFAAFLLTQAILSGRHRGVALSAPGVPGAVLGAGLLLAVSALLGLALGAIIRHTAGAIAAAVAVIYLLSAACLLLPSPWDDRIGRFTLGFAAYQVVSTHPQPGLLPPALSLLVLLAWPAAALLAAGLLLTHRDA